RSIRSSIDRFRKPSFLLRRLFGRNLSVTFRGSGILFFSELSSICAIFLKAWLMHESFSFIIGSQSILALEVNSLHADGAQSFVFHLFLNFRYGFQTSFPLIAFR